METNVERLNNFLKIIHLRWWGQDFNSSLSSTVDPYYSWVWYCEFAYLLKFTHNPTSILVVLSWSFDMCRVTKKLESPNVHIPSCSRIR